MRVAFAGGGTGGHVVPGLHLVERSLLAGAPGLDDLLWFTSGRPVEDRVLEGFAPPCAFERVALTLEASGGGAPGLGRLALRTPPAVLAARRALLRHRTQVLLGLGGYTTLPAALAARSLGVPVALLEINAVPGRATRTLARLASRVLHAWEGTLPPGGEGARDRLVGAPVAPAVAAVGEGRPAPGDARRFLGFDPGRPLLLVLGGSQGAGSLNAFLREHVGSLFDAGLQVLHQCGPGRLDETPVARPGLRVEEYLSPMAQALAAATVVLCRGGASTLAEVAAARRPALVVPYPHHADRHQERNARELGGGVELVEDAALGPGVVARLVALCGPGGAGERDLMAAELARVARRDPAGAVLEDLALLASGRAGGSTLQPTRGSAPVTRPGATADGPR